MPIPVPADPCGATHLGITEEASQRNPEYAGQQLIDGQEWTWTRKDDTLTVRYMLGGFCTYHSTRYMKFKVSDCIWLVRDYTHGIDIALSLEPTISHSYSDKELNFELQYWDEQLGIVGRNNDTEIWIDFSEDNRY